MTNLKHAVRNFWNDEEGVTAIEYGLLAALIAVVIVVGAGLLGKNLNCLFNYVATCITATTPGSCGTMSCT